MRDALIIFGMCAAAIAVGAWLYTYGPATSPEVSRAPTSDTPEVWVPPTVQQEESVAFTVIGHGSMAANVSERKNYALYSSEEYARIWKLTGSTEKMPTIDFNKAYVIAVFAGTRTTGGYSISVERILDSGEQRTVHVLIEKPGALCVTTQAVTSPYQFIRVPLAAHELAHIDTEREISCAP